MSTKETAKKGFFVRETATLEKVVPLRKVALGQYFTPPTVVEFMYQMLLAIMPAKDRRNPRIIDPACGEGIFLKYVLDNKITIPHQIYGVDIDPTAETRWKELDLFGKINLYLQDGLLDTEDKKVSTEHTEEIVGRFDIVIGNPPYGGMGIKNLNENKKLMDKIRKFELWGLAKIKNNEHPTFEFYYDSRYRNLTKEEIAKIERTPIEILFLERFIQLARPGKWIAIIVPDGILANTQLQYVRDWVLGKCNLKAVISLPRETFKFAGTTAKTSILFLQKRKKDEPLDAKAEVFMAKADYVGVIDERNELPQVLEQFKKEKGKRKGGTKMVMTIDPKHGELFGKRWDAGYWDPKYEEIIKSMRKGKWKTTNLGKVITEDCLIMGDHVRQSRGERLGRNLPYKYYDAVGFLETGYDWVNIETCSKNAYERLKRTEVKQDDLLIACSGVGAVGRVCLVTFDPGKSCTGAVFTLRTKKPNPYFLTVFFKSKYGEPQIERHRVGVGTVNIRGEDVFSWQIPLLPHSIQEKIESEYKKMSKYHDKAMAVKEKLIKQSKTKKEAEQDPDYQKNIHKAKEMLDDLIRKTEEVIEGKRNDIS